jgi:uncharacterized OB-fold protein
MPDQFDGITWNGEPLTNDNLDKYYEGVMVPINEIFYTANKPGWQCNSCGKIYVARGLPPSHECEETNHAANDESTSSD